MPSVNVPIPGKAGTLLHYASGLPLVQKAVNIGAALARGPSYFVPGASGSYLPEFHDVTHNDLATEIGDYLAVGVGADVATLLDQDSTFAYAVQTSIPIGLDWSAFNTWLVHFRVDPGSPGRVALAASPGTAKDARLLASFLSKLMAAQRAAGMVYEVDPGDWSYAAACAYHAFHEAHSGPRVESASKYIEAGQAEFNTHYQALLAVIPVRPLLVSTSKMRAIQQSMPKPVLSTAKTRAINVLAPKYPLNSTRSNTAPAASGGAAALVGVGIGAALLYFLTR